MVLPNISGDPWLVLFAWNATIHVTVLAMVSELVGVNKISQNIGTCPSVYWNLKWKVMRECWELNGFIFGCNVSE